MNGFIIVCPDGGTAPIQAIAIASNVTSAIVINGSIDGAAVPNFIGVFCDASFADCGGVLRGLSVTRCQMGISLGGTWMLDGCRTDKNLSIGIACYHNLKAVNCDASGNGAQGFWCYGSSSRSDLAGCTANDNQQQGFLLRTANLSNCSANGNTLNGIDAVHLTAANCLANLNKVNGMRFDDGSVISNCQAYSNANYGFSGSGAATLSDCQANTNAYGFFFLNETVVMTHCQATLNRGYGFDVGDHSTLTGCTANQNGGWGVVASFVCTFKNCTSTGNTNDGFNAKGNCVFDGCTATQNGPAHDSVAAYDQACGIVTQAHSTVRNCTIEGNNNNGIQVTGDCLVTGNNVTTNCLSKLADSAGIYLGGSANDVEDNAITDNQVDGINAAADRNFVARNRARNNIENYIAVDGNRFARIVVPALSTPIAGANTGSGTDGFTNTDPWANFSY